jgi:hypothetical protein
MLEPQRREHTKAKVKSKNRIEKIKVRTKI